jgi:hypothetical protein
LGLRVSVSLAKSHEERGRVERRIGIVRQMLERMVGNSTPVQTALQWQTLFAKIANTIDNLPLAKGDTTNRTDIGFEILTANRINLGRNNQRSLDGSGFSLDLNANLTKILEKNRQVYHTWYQLFIDQIHQLSMKPLKWLTNSRQPEVGDTVIFIYSDSGYGKKDRVWKLGKIIEAQSTKVKIIFFPTKAGKKVSMKPIKGHTLQRNPRDVSILFSLGELYMNSKEYFQKINE